MKDLERFIIPVNACGDGKTQDHVFIDDFEDAEQYRSQLGLNVSPTDYARANGLWEWWRSGKHCRPLYAKNTKIACIYWYRSGNANELWWGNNRECDHNYKWKGICPTMYLDVQAVINACKESNEYLDITRVKGRNGKSKANHLFYYTMDIGEYPKTKAKNSTKLEKAFLSGSEAIKPTGKKYTGPIKDDGTFTENLEYEFCGKRYVRVKPIIDEHSKCKHQNESDMIEIMLKGKHSDYIWMNVEPITWIVRNWNELPKEINPNGSGKAFAIDLRAEEIILSGIPFGKLNSTWQDSTLREMLNGVDISNENSNSSYFYLNGFLHEAFNEEIVHDLVAKYQNLCKRMETGDNILTIVKRKTEEKENSQKNEVTSDKSTRLREKIEEVARLQSADKSVSNTENNNQQEETERAYLACAKDELENNL